MIGQRGGKCSLIIYPCSNSLINSFRSGVVLLIFLMEVGGVAVGEDFKWSGAVEISGTRQWVEVKGSDIRNPVLLFLHGGPGNSMIPYSNRFTDKLQHHFLVVMWDQRGSGKTATLNLAGPTPSVEAMHQDVKSMIDYLRDRFSQDKIYLAGHSWGGFLALHAAAEYPELLRACFAISPMVNQVESERLSLLWMKERVSGKGREAARELESIKLPFEQGLHLYYHRKWLALLQAQKPPSKAFVLSWSRRWLPLFAEASAVNLSEKVDSIRCPVFFFIGQKDYQTHFKITQDFFQTVKAEKKELFWFTNSGHNLNLAEPNKLQEIIISIATTHTNTK